MFDGKSCELTIFSPDFIIYGDPIDLGNLFDGLVTYWAAHDHVSVVFGDAALADCVAAVDEDTRGVGLQVVWIAADDAFLEVDELFAELLDGFFEVVVFVLALLDEESGWISNVLHF